MLSVLLLTRDRAPLLDRCLRSLAAQEKVGDDWEVVVLDTGSRDATPELLHAWEKRGGELPFELLYERAEGGGAFAAMRNVAAAKARGEILLFTDDDCELPRDWVERGRHALEAGGGRDAVGGVVLGGNALPFGNWWRPELAWLAGLAVPGMFHREAAGAAHYPQTACLAIRRDAFEQFGFRPVREEFGEAAGIYLNEREDSALWRRLRRAGARICVDPAWCVFHATPAERARFATCRRRAERDGAAEALQLFNPSAAHHAARAVGIELCGAAGNLIAEAAKSLRTNIVDNVKNGTLAASAMAPLMWAARERAHVRAFRPLAPAKWRRPLARAALGGWRAGAIAQSKRAASGIARRMTSGRRSVAPPLNPRRVEIFADAFLGDLVLLEPNLRALAEQPDAPHITVWTGERLGRQLFAHCPYIDELRYFEEEERTRAAPRRASAASAWSVGLIAYWHRRPFAQLKRLSGDGRALPLVTFDRDMGFVRRHYYHLSGHRIHKSFDLHEIDNIARLFQWGGLAAPPAPFDFSYIEDVPRAIEATTRGCIAVQMGSAQPEKLWSDDRWARLLRDLAGRTGRPIILMGGPEESVQNKDFIHRHAIDAIDWPGDVDASVPAAFTLLRRAALLITTCSGIKHIAMAAGCPTVTLHGQSRERRWCAYFDADRHTVVRAAPTDLTKSERAGYIRNHEMLAIEPDAVLDAALQSLKASAKGGFSNLS